MREAYVAAKDVHVLPSQLPIPGAGLLPVNCYLVRGSEPVLVDTGMPIDAVDFADTLWSVVDPADLRWFGGAPIELSAQAIYTLSFLIFWGVIALGASLALLLVSLPDEVKPSRHAPSWPR